LAGVVAVVEVLGGLAILLGVYTQWAGYALALIMLGALFTAHGGQPWSGKEFAAMLFVLSLGVAWSAPGKIAVPLMTGKK
jgi:putative oxidoreductase